MEYLQKTIIISQRKNGELLSDIGFYKKIYTSQRAVIGSFVVFRDRGGDVSWNSIDFCGKSGGETADNYFVQGMWESAFRLGVFCNIKCIDIFHDKGSNELYNSSLISILV